jgi:CheY-like chemotaxis protein
MASHPVRQLDSNDAGLRILLVEDCDTDRDFVRRLLTVIWPHRGELQLDVATEAYEALDLIQTNSYALLLLDWRLPGMNGDRLLSALKRTGHWLPVVVLTGLEREELPADLEESGVVYLHKDALNITVLHQAIATALSNALRNGLSPAPLPAGRMPHQ